MNQIRICLILSILFLSGCVTLRDFEKMTPADRANFVCEQDSVVKAYKQQARDFEDMAFESSTAINLGYRMVKSCKRVKIEKPGNTVCRSYEYDHQLTTECKTETIVDYEEQCNETPVSVNIDHEKTKLRDYNESFERSKKRSELEFNQCFNRVTSKTAKEAYEYYKK
ncbi:hypothetical protein [Endozoicomonas sp.]|uniref:hypothetical protein n=1 Tax=Endozoicomonas sp. TaxID=1892382 RepID=UPI003AF59ABD